MDKLIKLGHDISRLWTVYYPTYFNGVKNTLILAVVATLIGCIIGLITFAILAVIVFVLFFVIVF